MEQGRLTPRKVVIIGASTGGPPIIEKILKKLPRRLKAAIIIIQHLPSRYTKDFADRLRHISPLAVHEASDGDILLPGSAVLLRGDTNFTIVKQERFSDFKYILHETTASEPRCSGCLKPNIDTTMISASKSFGKDTIAIILSGMGNDGYKGVKEIRKKGGTVIIEDSTSSVVYGMPVKVYKEKLYDYVLTPGSIAQKIIELCS